jgi:hypothetical protein
MRMAHARRLIAAALTILAPPLAAHAQDVAAAAPHDVSVTVYRNPYRGEGGFDLNNLGGFAFITETRRVVLPPGEHRLRFEGVADGIEPASAIVTGLPSAVIEKNRDAALLSPAALVEAAQAQGGRVTLARTNPATGATRRREGVIRSAAGGVVVETADGVEALRCSGMPETFGFESAGTGLSARPTLSVLTRTAAPIEAIVQLSYLSRGFDWSADYVATMSATPGKLDLGAWVTLANGNGAGFPNARVQVVAGRLNRSTGQLEPIILGQPILAYCWPQDTTSDLPPPVTIERAFPLGFDPDGNINFAPGLAENMVVVTAQRREITTQDMAVAVAATTMSEAEDLGDLKLYRVPDRATVASRQSKQVRMLDRAGVPVTRLYESDFSANSNMNFRPMTILLRTRNDTENNLGVPLPSGRVSVFETAGTGAAAQRLLSAETGLRDIAIDEETELRLAQSPDVQIRQTVESRTVTGPPLPAVTGADRLDASPMLQVNRIEITNARPFEIQAEVRLSLSGAQQLARADHPADQKNGRPIFRVTLPANASLEIRYQTTSR